MRLGVCFRPDDLSCLVLGLQMSSLDPYVGYADGASRSPRNIASAAWVLFDPSHRLVESGGIFLGPATNNVAEYSSVIALLGAASALGISRLVVYMDSQLVVSQLNHVYQVRDPILLRKVLRVRLWERHFEFITYIHIPRAFNSLADSLASYVIEWHSLH